MVFLTVILLLVIIVIYLEQQVFRQRKLGKDHDGTKNSLVLGQLVAKWGGQYCPILYPCIDHLLMAPHPLLHLHVV